MIIEILIYGLGFIIGWFVMDKHLQKSYSQIKFVQIDDIIKIEHNKAEDKVIFAKCINNDPKLKKIVLEVHWSSQVRGDYKQQFVYKYSSKELSNFNILNDKFKYIIQKDSNENIEDQIEKEKENLNNCLKVEDYIRAREIQNKIDDLIKKLK